MKEHIIAVALFNCSFIVNICSFLVCSGVHGQIKIKIVGVFAFYNNCHRSKICLSEKYTS